MPTYEYHCKACGHQEEVFQKISDAALTNCPNCHKEMLCRGPGGGIGLQFHGEGFYITDYGSKTASPKKKNNDDKSVNEVSQTAPTSKCGCGKKACPN